MTNIENHLNQKLQDKSLISAETLSEINEYKAKNIFSLHNELLTLLYVSIIMFTGGIGVLIYQNIDSIGHIALLGINFAIMMACFFFANKKFKGWSKNEVLFENSLYDYVVLLGSILLTIFLGYLQFQYKIFGSYFELVSLFTAIFCFAIAYYFDNKTVLSIAITGLVSFFGITLSYTNIESTIFNNIQLTITGLILGAAFLVWINYCNKINFKKHFHFIFLTFAFHLIGISCMAGIAGDYSLIFIPITIAFVYYFYKISKSSFALSIYVFTLLYAFIGCNIAIAKLFDYIDSWNFIEPLFFLSPFFYIGAIVLFIMLIKKFKKEKDASLL